MQAGLVKCLAKAHGIKLMHATVSKMLKRSNELLHLDDTSENLIVKRHHFVAFPLLEAALYQWITKCKKSNQYERRTNQGEGKWVFPMPLSGCPCNQIFEWLARKVQASTQHPVASLLWREWVIEMEALSVWQPEIRKILDEYALEDIYNMDKTRLFYCMQVDNSLATRQLEGRKQNKERITIAICCNASGSDKMPLWISRKSFNPRCFKNVNRENLGVSNYANQNA